MKIANYITFIISIAGLVFSIALIIMGNAPCSGDGCMIHFLYIFGTITLLFFGVLFYLSYRNIKKIKRTEKEV